MREAVKLGDAYHSDSSNQAKCIKCSKINVATVSYKRTVDKSLAFMRPKQ